MKCSTTPFNPCPSFPNAQCVVYTGPNLTNINVTTNMRLDTILQTINEAVDNFEFNLFTEDTVTLDLSGDGSQNTPLFGDVNISEFGNNAILTLVDGLYVPNTIQNGVVMGGIVTWLQDYDYHVSPAVYYINGVRYDQRGTFPFGFDFTLSPPDGVYNRLDTFIVDVNGDTLVLEGTPSDNPTLSPYDVALQLPLSFALVEVGTTEPTIDVECLYKNNNESPLWINSSSNSTRLNPDSAFNPCNGNKSVEGTGVVTGDNILFTRSSNFIPGASHSLVTFLIRSKGFSGNNNFMSLRFEFNGTPVGTPVALRNLAFGFQGTDTSNCQIISIPFSFFGLSASSIVNSFRMTGSVAAVGGIGFWIDDICLQGQPLPTGPTNLDEKVKVSSNDTTAGYILDKLVAGGGVTLTENNNGANETVTISVTTTLSADNGLTENVTNNIQLGGPLLHDTVVTNDIYQMDFVGTHANYVFGVNNNGSGSAGDFASIGGTAVVGAGVKGGTFTGTTGGVEGFAIADGGIAGLFGGLYTSTNTSVNVATIQRLSSGTAAAGLGGTLQYDLENASGGISDAGSLGMEWVTATAGLEDSRFTLSLVDGGVTARKLAVENTGQLILDEYGAGTFTGTETYILGVDASGNVIEVAAPSSFVTTADNGLIINPAGNVQLGNDQIVLDAVNGAPLIRNTAIDVETFSLVIGGNKSFFAESHNPVVTIANRNTSLTETSEALWVKANGTLGTALVVTSEGIGATIISEDMGLFVQSQNSSGAQIGTMDPGSSAIFASSSGGDGLILSGLTYGNNDNDVITSVSLWRASLGGGPMGNGVGQAIEFIIDAGPSGSPVRSNRIISQWTDAPVLANRKSELSFTTVHDGVEATQFSLASTGAIRNHSYGDGTFTGTPTYAAAWDTNGNLIETPVAGGSLIYTADNGLTMLSNNTQLGGTLLHNTLIDTTTAYSLTVDGDVPSSTADGTLIVINNNADVASAAIHASSTTAIAGKFQSPHSAVISTATGANGVAIFGVSGSGTSAIGVYGQSASGIPVSSLITAGTSATIETALSLGKTVAAGGGDGTGLQITLGSSVSTGTRQTSHSLISKWTTANSATRVSQFEIWGVDNAVTDQQLTLKGSGQLQLNNYGIGTFTGTSAFMLTVDASGNIIEETLPTSGGISAITADNGLTANTSTNVRLGGTLMQVTDINTSTFKLNMTGSNATELLNVVNSGAGDGAYFEGNTTTGTGIEGVGAFGGVFRGTMGVQGLTTVTAGLGGYFSGEFASTNTLTNIVSISRSTTGTPANGIGAAINFDVETTSGIGSIGRIGFTVTDVGAGVVDSAYHLYLQNNGTTNRVFNIDSTGKIGLDEYGTGTQTGTPAYALNVDSSGNIIEAALGSGMSNPMGAIGDLITSSDGAGTPVAISPGAAGTVLTSNGAGAQPTWQAGSGGSGITRVVSSIAAPTTLAAAALTDYVYFVSGTTTVTLPTAVGNTNRYTVFNTGVNTITIDTTGGQTIDGDPTYSLLSQYEVIDLVSNNSQWFII